MKASELANEILEMVEMYGDQEIYIDRDRERYADDDFDMVSPKWVDYKNNEIELDDNEHKYFVIRAEQ